jgi:sugar O-acyltransferase (sialic acid O-acetyltransferase NeuD family)
MIIIGSGAQAKYAVDILHHSGASIERIFNLPDHPKNKSLYYIGVENFDLKKIPVWASVVICCKDNDLKEKIYKELQHKNINFPPLVHPKAVISKFAEMKEGSIINANAVIQPEAKIGKFCMIHAGVIIEHNCIIEDFVNLAPSVTLAGGVKVGKYTTINTGTVVAPNVTIGMGCLIGAGSLILKNVPAGSKIFGHPATLS